MSSRRSDTPAPAAPAPAPSWRGSARELGWRTTLLSNAPVPVVIALLALLAPLVEGRGMGYNAQVVMLVGYNIVLAVSLQLINGFSGQFSLGHAGFMMVGAYLAAYPAITHSDGMKNPATTLWFYLSLGAVTVAAAAVVLGLFLAIRASRKVRRWLPTVLLILVAAWVVADLSQGSKHEPPPARFVWSRGIVLVQESFAWLMDHGAWAAKVSAKLPAATRGPATFVVLLVGAGLCAAGAGLVVGIPALRLRGDYLAIATLGMAEIIRIVIQNSQPLGGARQPVAESPQEALVLDVGRGEARHRLRARCPATADRGSAHAATASAGTSRTYDSAARCALAKLASASMPSGPTQSPAT